jgi:tetratricopeptide (TPR) repeat protein
METYLSIFPGYVSLLQLAGANEKALDMARKELEVCRYQSGTGRRGSCLNRIGYVQFLLGDYQGAMENFHRSHELLVEAADDEGLAKSHLNIGNILAGRGDTAGALERFEASLLIYRRLGNMPGQASCLLSIGNILYGRADYDAALSRYQESLGIRESIGDIMGQSKCLHNIDNIHYYRGDFDKSLECAERALRLREKMGDRPGRAAGLLNLSNIYQIRDDLPLAMDCAEKSLDLRTDMGDLAGQIGCLNVIAGIHAQRGEHRLSLECYRRSLELQERIGHKLDRCEAVCGLANAKIKLKDREGVRELLEKNLALAAELGSPSGEAKCHEVLARLFSAEGGHRDAERQYLTAASIYEEIGQTYDAAQILYELGVALVKIGRQGEAAAHLQRARDIFLDIKLGSRAASVDECMASLGPGQGGTRS